MNSSRLETQRFLVKAKLKMLKLWTKAWYWS